MAKPKIIFFDIDGTLVPLKEGIRPRTVEALQKLRQNGIKLCIATGRAPMEVPKFEGVTFDAFLTYNGSYCFTPERDVFKNLIPKADIALLRRNAEALGRPMALATKDRLTANGSDPDLAEYFAIGGVELVIADDFDAMAQGEIFQVLMSGREAEYPAILKDVENAKIAAPWISSRPAAARASPWKRCWNSTASTSPTAWPSVTATTISKCSEPSAPASLWPTPLPGCKPPPPPIAAM